MTELRDTDGLSEDEFKQFMGLLRRFCSHDLDQWEHWQMETPYGPAYVSMSRAPIPGAGPDLYWQV